MSDINIERKRAVRHAWRAERNRVREGFGTRDWSQAEQRELIAKGQAKGYHGHHMKSVKAFPEYAGNPDNIQFLNHFEHYEKVHNKNTRTAINGYYNYKTGEIHKFNGNELISPQVKALSSPLTERQKKNTITKEKILKKEAAKAKSLMYSKDKSVRPTIYTLNNLSQRNNRSIVSEVQTKTNDINNVYKGQTVENKGIETMRTKIRECENTSNVSALTKNKGIQRFKEKEFDKNSSHFNSPQKISSQSFSDIKNAKDR